MSDITKCNPKNCPLKETCYRFTAPVDDMWQSYFVEVPYDKEKKECKYYYKR
jgi:hypothetical protein